MNVQSSFELAKLIELELELLIAQQQFVRTIYIERNRLKNCQFFVSKVEKVLKGSLNSIPSPSPAFSENLNYGRESLLVL